MTSKSPADELGLCQKILAAECELRNLLGKSPGDALALFEQSHEDFNFAAAGWSSTQFLAASKLLVLCGLRGASTKKRMSGMASAWLATVLDEVNGRQASKTINDMLPDCCIGKKVRNKGVDPHVARLQRCSEAEKFREIDRGLPPLLSRNRRHKLIAKEFFGAEKKYKTVERRLKEFPPGAL